MSYYQFCRNAFSLRDSLSCLLCLSMVQTKQYIFDKVLSFHNSDAGRQAHVRLCWTSRSHPLFLPTAGEARTFSNLWQRRYDSRVNGAARRRNRRCLLSSLCSRIAYGLCLISNRLLRLYAHIYPLAFPLLDWISRQHQHRCCHTNREENIVR